MLATTLDNIRVSFGSREILSGITWQIHDDSRVGLIGANGSGKTTLFNVILGQLPPTSGRVHFARDVAVGHVAQDVELTPGTLTISHLIASRQDLLDARERLSLIEERMEQRDATERQMEQYGTLHDFYERQGGYALEARCKAVMAGLGFDESSAEMDVGILSGGQRNRLALATLLVKEPNLLLLDEPTNHLDIEATEWLEDFLGSYRGGVVVISHDRTFLDRVATQIAEIDNGQLSVYQGNHTAWVAEKARRESLQRNAYTLQKAEIERQEDFIRRNLAGQKTKQAQARLRQLEKTTRLAPPSSPKSLSLRFGSDRKGSGEVLELRDLSKSYDGVALFEGVSQTVRRGDRIAVVGPNGSGKTTLLQSIVGDIKPDSGIVRMGVGIDVGYFDQQRQDLDTRSTVLDEVWSARSSATPESVRTYLGSFLFSGDDVERVVGTLSGGEQNRVALAKLILARVNCLILDEPTNHLDLPSRIVLEEALAKFEGTIILVSHDRALLSAVANRIWVVGDGKIKVFEGGYRAFEEGRHGGGDLPKSPVNADMDSGKADRTHQRQQRKDTQRTDRRRAKKLHKIEKEIAKIESQIAARDLELADHSTARDWQQLAELTQKQEKANASLEELFSEWSELETGDVVGVTAE